jgi:hypothetical protein
MTLMFPKDNPIRDRKYLDYLRSQSCLLTGFSATETMAVDPMHIGTGGKSLKIGDDCAIPVVHYLHRDGHQSGEISMLREHAPDWLLRECFRAYAQNLYADWKAGR